MIKTVAVVEKPEPEAARAPVVESHAKIFVRLSEPGFHCWPGAPHHRAYLRNAHRHLFHIEVSTWVGHDDREIEFHDLQQTIRDIWKVQFRDGECRDHSCERLARIIGRSLVDLLGKQFDVTVSEDGECGALVSSFPPSP